MKLLLQLAEMTEIPETDVYTGAMIESSKMEKLFGYGHFYSKYKKTKCFYLTRYCNFETNWLLGFVNGIYYRSINA